MADYVVRATAAKEQIRAFSITSKEMTEYARKAHDTSPVVTAALGRTMAAASMMGTMMKSPTDVMTIQLMGAGPMKSLTVTSDVAGNVKGFAANPQVILPAKNGKLDVGGAIGMGVLRVIRDLGLKEPYVGTVELKTGEVAEDLTYYFATSEQTPSSVGLGVLMTPDNTVDVAGGFIVQLMPDTTDEVIDRLEENIKKLEPVTTMLKNGMTPEDMLSTVLEGLELCITDKSNVGFVCDCSRERVHRSLSALGVEDLNSILEDDKPVEVRCQFCNKDYQFSLDEIRKILSARKEKISSSGGEEQ
ncbi:MAG: Hsp33 family molecular chaperone HslO [Lachnospiraceae bacterium]|nr:Hsp33 family molecular chaperone HslO [Lachnospiraceae bacterium]